MKALAFDFGGSTARALLGCEVGGEIVYEEVARFDNVPVVEGGHMRWDFGALWGFVKSSIKKAKEFDCIGIDTWGVDYGVIKDGRLVASPVHYRDDRTIAAYDELLGKIGKEELYFETGTQVMRINTIFQLYAERDEVNFADKILMMPDLFAYCLTGAMKCEYTIASTTGLLDAVTRDWNYDLIDRIGLKRSIFPEIVGNGSFYGCIRDELADELGIERGIPVIAVCTHDTASAVVAMKGDPRDTIYISCGTWSLMGVVRKAVDTTDDSYTNEGGHGGSVTYLRNIMGLWLMQETRRIWKRELPSLTFADMDAMMEGCEPCRFIVDTNSEDFVAPDDMPRAIAEYCLRTGQGKIESKGQIVRCIYDSLACAYAEAAKSLNEKFGNAYKRINILGGGSKAQPLARLTAEMTGLEVVCGPAEATAVGNIKVCLETMRKVRA